MCFFSLSGTASALSDDEAFSLHWGPSICDSSRCDSSHSENPAEETLVDEVLLEVVIEDPSICCLLPRLELAGYPILAGPLYWRRLKILCPNIRPTAMC